MSRVGAVNFGGVAAVVKEGSHAPHPANLTEARTAAVQVLPLALPSLTDLCLHAVARHGPSTIAEALRQGVSFPEYILAGLVPEAAAAYDSGGGGGGGGAAANPTPIPSGAPRMFPP